MERMCWRMRGGYEVNLLSVYNSDFALLTDGTKKPGPGAHSPEKCNISRRSMPSHSMGIRHSEYVCPLIIDLSD